MENVDRSLRQVSSVLQKLLEASQDPTRGSATAAPTTEGGGSSPASFPPLQTPVKIEGYRGDSSFNAHVQRLAEALKGTKALTPAMGGGGPGPDFIPAVAQIMDEATGGGPEPGNGDGGQTAPSAVQGQYSDLECKPLPPMDRVLRLLRLARNETQRLFIDIPVIDVHEVTDLCQQVYFAVQDYSIFTWATVNVCLFYLFVDLKQHHYGQIGVTSADVQSYLVTLAANINAVIPSLRLCQEPKLEACQAFDLMVTPFPFLLHSFHPLSTSPCIYI